MCSASTFAADTDAALALLSTCVRFVGGLEVGDDVTSLAALSSLAFVDGDLTLDADALVDLSGLGALRSVTGTLTVQNVARVDGATALTTVGALVVEDTGLVSLAGLDTLTTIVGMLSIVDNEILLDPTLPALTSLGGPIVVEDNPHLAMCRVEALAAAMEPGAPVVDLGGNGDGACF